MAIASEAIDFVLANEGGLANVAGDAGGITNFGISYRFLTGVAPLTLKSLGLSLPVTAQSIIGLTKPIAVDLYSKLFWNVIPYGSIQSQRLANYIFDAGVAMGINTGVRVAQRGCNALLGNAPITVDGILGQQTLTALNCIPEKHLLVALPAARARLYHTIVLNNPGDQQFLTGWIKRANRI